MAVSGRSAAFHLGRKAIVKGLKRSSIDSKWNSENAWNLMPSLNAINRMYRFANDTYRHPKATESLVKSFLII
jgi:hypothetical protein